MKKNKIEYNIFVYRGDSFSSRLLEVFPQVKSLHDCMNICKAVLRTIYSLHDTGFCKIVRNGLNVGDYRLNKDSNLFVFNAYDNPFEFKMNTKNETKN